MSSARRITAVAILVLVVVGLTAAPAAAGPTRAQLRAKRLFRAGQAAYKDKDFLRAAELFRRGYKLDPRPAFLLNVAQSYRMASKAEIALQYYERYLELAPRSRVAAQVRKLVEKLRAELKPQPKPQPKPPPYARTDPDTPRPPPADPFYKKWWFWTAVGGAVAAVVVSLGVYAGTRPDYVREGGLGVVKW